ncbi:dnaJ homolog subfamily C member 30, mitochondrial [Denticeps clupeoides]|uniref:J domain-containing protein n=1 Tax=Denticeps clupeoides TaxID=299321 RepID=A0AAY4EJG6_9TELE|nr:dnaJ homolog subfamily C member 30, mitochondrial [Denticeps clupeoides]
MAEVILRLDRKALEVVRAGLFRELLPTVSAVLTDAGKKRFSALRAPPAGTARHGACVGTGALRGPPPAATSVRGVRLYSGSPGGGNEAEYYDILQVSPAASQAQIKTAYYKQSFIYHPDKNAGREDAARRFSQISEAYRVLGNRALRRKYDRGLLTQTDLQSAGRPSAKDPPGATSGPGTRPGPARPPGAPNRDGFDYDAYIRAHYGEQLQREQQIRSRREALGRQQKAAFRTWKLDKMTEAAAGLLVALAALVLFSLHASK